MDDRKFLRSLILSPVLRYVTRSVLLDTAVVSVCVGKPMLSPAGRERATSSAVRCADLGLIQSSRRHIGACFLGGKVSETKQGHILKWNPELKSSMK